MVTARHVTNDNCPVNRRLINTFNLHLHFLGTLPTLLQKIPYQNAPIVSLLRRIRPRRRSKQQ